MTTKNILEDRFLPVISLACCFLTGLVMVEDYLTSYRADSAFYWNESLLFSSSWLCVLPVYALMRVAINHPLWKRKVADHLLLALVALISHMILYAALVSLVSALTMDHYYHFPGNLQYGFSSGLVVYLLVYVALALHLYSAPREKVTPAPLERLEVDDAKGTSFIQVADILYVKSADPYLAIHTKGRKFLYRSSLKELELQLPSAFARIHRSTIARVDAVSQMMSRGNGDYDLHMTDGQVLRLSRYYATRFRQQLNGLTPPGH